MASLFAAHSTLPRPQRTPEQDFGFGKPEVLHAVTHELPASKPRSSLHCLLGTQPPLTSALAAVSAMHEAAGEPVCLPISTWHQDTGG